MRWDEFLFFMLPSLVVCALGLWATFDMCGTKPREEKRHAHR